MNPGWILENGSQNIHQSARSGNGGFQTVSDRSRDSLGLFMPLATGSQSFYRRADRFHARGGPQRAVLLPPGAPKPASGIPNPPADSALHYRSFGGVPGPRARLTACLVMPTTGSQSFPPAAKRLAVLLLARGVRRRWRSAAVYPRDHAAKWAK